MLGTYPRYAFLGLLMLAAATIAQLITAREPVRGSGEAVNLDEMVPRAFGDWRLDPGDLPAIVPPSRIEDVAGRIYGKVLNRTYINDMGERVMLTLAWGRDQSDALRVHSPEVCYGAQGFQVSEAYDYSLKLENGRVLPIKRLLARRALRSEPVTYWIVVGGQVVNGRLERKLVQIKHGLTGEIPDGLLVRVSSIGRDAVRAYALQEAFIRAMYRALDSGTVNRLMGHETKKGVVQ